MVFAQDLTRRMTAVFGEDDEFYQLAVAGRVFAVRCSTGSSCRTPTRRLGSERCESRGLPVYAIG